MDKEKLVEFVNDLIEGLYQAEENNIYEHSSNIKKDLEELEQQREDTKKEFEKILEG